MEIPLYSCGKYHLPVATGKYVVGCTDVMTGLGLEGCFFRLFYPCAGGDVYDKSSSWPKWVPHSKYVEGLASVVCIPLIGRTLVSWAFGNCYVPVIEDAVPASDAKFPVVIFSHGLTGCRTSYSLVCSEIASHGFVVAAMEHRDGSACMTYTMEEDEQKWIHYLKLKFERDDMPIRLEQLQLRIKECGRALDTLVCLNEGKPVNCSQLPDDFHAKLEGLMDTTNPLIVGHSFGASTAIRTLSEDKRFRAGIAMDAWMWPLKDHKELPDLVDQPILFINMEAFQTEGNLKAMRRLVADQADVERRVVTLKGSVHKNQVDIPFLLPLYLRRLAGAHSVIDPHLAIRLNNRLIMLFLWKHLGYPSNEEYVQFIESEKDWIFEGFTTN